MSEKHREPDIPEEGVPVVARGMGSSRQANNRRRRTRKGPGPAGVQTPLSTPGWHMQGGRMNQHPALVPSSRRDNTSSESRAGLPKKGEEAATWYGDDSPHLPCQSQPCFGGSKGLRLREQARLVKTVNIEVKWAAAHPGQDRRLPSVVTHSRLQRATSVRSRVGIVLEDGSGVAIDWVTGRSYSSARRRISMHSQANVGAGKCVAAPYPSVAVRDRGH